MEYKKDVINDLLQGIELLDEWIVDPDTTAEGFAVWLNSVQNTFNDPEMKNELEIWNKNMKGLRLRYNAEDPRLAVWMKSAKITMRKISRLNNKEKIPNVNVKPLKSILRNHIKLNHDQLEVKLGSLMYLKAKGEGGNGLVYEGEILNSPVAVKFLISEAQSKSKLDRFKAEYFNIVSLNIPKSIVKLYAYDEISIDGHTFPLIIMKLYNGSLASKVKENRSSNILTNKRDVEKLLLFLLDSLDFIHDNGVFHRDMKPENILISDDTFILTDFGIAYFNPEIFLYKAKTRENERLANYLFAAPEQLEGDMQPSATMDIYALGQIIQWYITGQTHRGTNRKLISEYLEGINNLDALIEKCLRNDPNDRFQNISEIRKFIQTESIFASNEKS